MLLANLDNHPSNKVLQSGKIDHEKQTLTTYTGDEGFEAGAESFKKLAVPQFTRTLQSLRNRPGVPLNKLENATVSLEQDVQEKFSKLFGQPGDSGGASEFGEAA